MSIPAWQNEPPDHEPVLSEADAAFEAANRHHHQVADQARRLRVAADAKALVKAEQDQADQIPPFDLGLLSSVLARPEEPAHRAEGLIRADAGTLIIAQRKLGKTTLLLNVCRTFITGEPLLGRFPVTPIEGRIAFLNFEVSAQQLAHWAADVGVDPDRLVLVTLRGRRNPFSHPRDLEQLAATLRAHNTETLIVDPFGRAYNGTNQNDPGEVGAWLSALDVFARSEVGARDVILATHAGWNGERTRGATSLEDWADTFINLVRDKDDERQRFLRAEGRDVLVDEDLLEFDPTTRLLTMAGSGSRRVAARTRQVDTLIPVVAEILAGVPHMSGNALDTAIKAQISSGDLDVRHSKGDGAKAAQLLERRGMVASKDGPRGARQFTLLTRPEALTKPTTSPTSPDLPTGTSGDFPSSPIGREVAQGTETTSPTQGTQPTPEATP